MAWARKTIGRGKFVKLLWRCRPCRQAGNWRVWLRPGETNTDGAKRWTQHTRSACVAGCPFLSAVKFGGVTDGDPR